MIERARQPHFGYFEPRDEYFQSIIRWHETRNGVTGLRPEHIGYENGVLGGVVSTLQAFARPGDAVLLHSPTYIGFTGSIENAGFKIVHSPLVQDEAGVWRMDYADMERKLAEHKIHVAVMCSPHNPCGRVWERAELEQAMELYRKYDCVVISDEIWSDIIFARSQAYAHAIGFRRRPSAHRGPLRAEQDFQPRWAGGELPHHLQQLPARPRDGSGLQGALQRDERAPPCTRSFGAYRPEGQAWVDELVQVLGQNVDWACSYIAEHFEGVRVSKPEGTYMLFLDCTDWCAAHGRDIDWVLREGWRVGVDYQDGRPFPRPLPRAHEPRAAVCAR